MISLCITGSFEVTQEVLESGNMVAVHRLIDAFDVPG